MRCPRERRATPERLEPPGRQDVTALLAHKVQMAYLVQQEQKVILVLQAFKVQLV